ncbi:MAG: hypothetical protein IK115_08350 [Lachnospiraceae bacterium]|nr:hypothetical protein [Lachnospiraceae bacterium]
MENNEEMRDGLPGITEENTDGAADTGEAAAVNTETTDAATEGSAALDTANAAETAAGDTEVKEEATETTAADSDEAKEKATEASEDDAPASKTADIFASMFSPDAKVDSDKKEEDKKDKADKKKEDKKDKKKDDAKQDGGKLAEFWKNSKVVILLLVGLVALAGVITAVILLRNKGKTDERSKPVQAFCEALVKLDYAGMCQCFEADSMTDEDFTMVLEDFSDLGLEDMWAARAANISYTLDPFVVDPEDEEFGTVSVNMVYQDYSTGITTALNTFYKEYDEDEEGLVDETRLAELLREHYTKDTPATIQEVVIFYLEKLEDGTWVLSYDSDMIDQVMNAASGNLINVWLDYDYDYEDWDDEDWDDEDWDDEDWDDEGPSVGDLPDDVIDRVLSENGIERTDGMDLDEYEDLFADYLEEYEDEEDAFYDECIERLLNVESSGTMLVMNCYIEEEEEEDEEEADDEEEDEEADDEEEDEYLIVYGDVYDYDVYMEWLSIVNSVPNFEEVYPDLYDEMDNGLLEEEMEIFIPTNLGFSGKWGGGTASVSSIRDLINQGKIMVYTPSEDSDDEAAAVYEF